MAALVGSSLPAPELPVVAALTLAVVQDPRPVIAGQQHYGVVIFTNME